MSDTLHLYTGSIFPTSVSKEYIEFTEFIDSCKVEKLE